MKDILIDMNRKHDFLICVDSDGCVFDNMELKHKECFCPATVNVWNLQSVSRYAREAAEFVNLYSTTRGANRFPAVIQARHNGFLSAKTYNAFHAKCNGKVDIAFSCPIVRDCSAVKAAVSGIDHQRRCSDSHGCCGPALRRSGDQTHGSRAKEQGREDRQKQNDFCLISQPACSIIKESRIMCKRFAHHSKMQISPALPSLIILSSVCCSLQRAPSLSEQTLFVRDSHAIS